MNESKIWGRSAISSSEEPTTTTPPESPRPDPGDAELHATVKYIRTEKQRAVLNTCHRCRSIEYDHPGSIWIFESGNTRIMDHDEINAAVSEAVSMEIKHGGPALAATERYGLGYVNESQPIPDETDSPAWEHREGETPDDHIRRVGDGYVSKL